MLASAMGEDSLEGQPKEEFSTIVAERGRGTMSLGGLLRDLRISRGMDQRDLESALRDGEIGNGLSLSQPILSRFERGERPSKDQLDALFLILNPDLKTSKDIFLAGGYLPSKAELEGYKDTFEVILQDWSKRGLPCVIMEGLGWRYVAWNSEADKLFHLSEAGEVKRVQVSRKIQPDDELREFPQLIEMILNPDYFLNREMFSTNSKWAQEFAAQQLNNFQRQTEAWSKLPWYKAIMNDIYRSPHFAIVRRRSESHSDTPSWLSYGHTEFPVNVEGNKVRFMEFASELNTDRRFEVLRYVPLPQSKP